MKIKISKKQITTMLKKAVFTFTRLILPSLVIILLLGGCLFPNNKIYSFILSVGLLKILGSQHQEYMVLFGNQITIIGFFILSCAAFFIIRRMNKEKSFNNGSLYHNYRYFTYFYASKILNYKSLNLILIPVPMQFKLVINQTFSKFTYGDDLPVIVKEKITITEKKTKRQTKVINLLLSDTFKVEEEFLPREVRKLPTIHIARELSGDRVRRFSPEFIIEIRKTISKHGDDVEAINLFAYTNTQHNYRIAKDCFVTGGRTKLEKINVFQPDRKNFRFGSKKIEIFL